MDKNQPLMMKTKTQKHLLMKEKKLEYLGFKQKKISSHYVINLNLNISSKQRTIIGAYLNHLITRFIIILLIITDISLVLAAVSLPGI